jgi:hypothetical protein
MHGTQIRRPRGRPRKYAPTQIETNLSALKIKPQSSNIGVYRSQLPTVENKIERSQRRKEQRRQRRLEALRIIPPQPRQRRKRS